MDSLDAEEFLDPRVKRTIGILETWESSHLDEVREQEKNAVQAVSDSEIAFILDRIIPDGGLAWLLVFTTWISNGITNGVGFSYGLILSGIVDTTRPCPPSNGTATACQDSGVSLPLLTTIGNVHTCVLYLTTPVILLHSNRVRRLTDFAYMGALLACLGLFLSSLIDYRRYSSFLLLHFSIITGLGLAIQTTLQATVLSHNFNRRMSIAAGITSSGNGLFSGLLSLAISLLNARLGVRFSFLLLSGLAASGLLYTQRWRANRDFLLLQKWVRTPAPLITELLAVRVLRNRRYLLLFLSVFCLYSGLFYPWMVLMEYAKAQFTESQMSTVTYVYTVRGFSNAVLRFITGFVITAAPVRRRLLYAVPVNQSMYLCGLTALLIGLETRSLPLLFLAAGVTALGESLVITTMPALVTRLTNPADTPAGVVLMNLTYSLASLLPPMCMSLVSDSVGNYRPAFIISCGFTALGCLLSLTLVLWRPGGGDDESGDGGGGGGDDSGGDGGGGGGSERYIALDGSLAAQASSSAVRGSGGGGGSDSDINRAQTRSRVRSAAASDNRSVTRRAVKLNAYKVTAWRQQECDVGQDCFEKVPELSANSGRTLGV